MATKKVSFSFSGVLMSVSTSSNIQEYSENEDSSSESEESFKEITTSKEESSWCSLDEQDTEVLQLALDAARALSKIYTKILQKKCHDFPNISV